MTKFITSTSTEAGSSPQIKKILSGKNVRVASAFLGKGAEIEVKKGTRLICDIGMGGTNPAVLQALSEKLGDDLRHLPDFHAKVYLSDDGCVVGSSNLSNRGVGFLSQAKLLEASVFMEPSEESAIDAGRWFDEIWETAKVVGNKDILLAMATWKSNKRGAPVSRQSTAETFFDALGEDGNVSAEWGFILTNEDFDIKLEEIAEARRTEVIGDLESEPNGRIDQYSNLEISDNPGGYYISLHREPDGEVTPNALKLIGSIDHKWDEGGDTDKISYFEILDWKMTEIPKPDKEQLKRGGDLSKVLKSAKDEFTGRVLSIDEVRKVLNTLVW